MSKSSWSILIVVFVFLGLLGGGLAIFGLGDGGVDEAVVEEQVGVEGEVPVPVVTGVKEEVKATEEVAEELSEEAEVVVAEEEPETEVAEEEEVKKLTKDQEIALIEKYYGLLEDGKLEDAYAMKFEPKESFKTFKGWYGNVTSANPHDFTKTGDSRYQFLVDLKEEGGVESKYQVVMEIIEGKLLKTISSKDITSSKVAEENIYSSSLKSYSKKIGDNKWEIYLVRNGVEVLVDSMVNEEYVSMELLGFSNSGKYLMYRIVNGVDGNSLSVYDTVLLQKVHSVYAPENAGFADDEKYFYECQGMGMMGGYVKILVVPDFGLKEDLTPPYGSGLGASASCVYDSGSNLLRYTLFNLMTEEVIEHVYAF